MKWKKYGVPMFVFEADKGAGSGGGTSDGDGNKTGDQNNQQNGGAGDKNTGGENGNGNGDQGKQNQNAKTFTQEEVDKMISDRLARESKKREDDAKAKQGQFEPLYQQEKTARETAENNLTTITGQRDKYAEILNRNIDAQIKDWPEEVKAFDPGKDSLEARQNWVEKSLPLVTKLNAGQNKTVNGEHGSKNGNGNSTNVIDQVMGSMYKGPAGISSDKK